MGLENQSLISLLTGFKQEESGRILFFREGPQKEWLRTNVKNEIFIVASESSFRMWIVSYLIVLSMMSCFWGPRQLGLTEEVSQRFKTRYPCLKLKI